MDYLDILVFATVFLTSTAAAGAEFSISDLQQPPSEKKSDDSRPRGKHRVDIYVDKKDKKMIVVDQDLQNNILNISTRNVPDHPRLRMKRVHRKKRQFGIVKFAKAVGGGIKEGFRKLGEFVLKIFH